MIKRRVTDSQGQLMIEICTNFQAAIFERTKERGKNPPRCRVFSYVSFHATCIKTDNRGWYYFIGRK